MLEFTLFDKLAPIFVYSAFVAIITAIFSIQYQSTGIFNVAIPGYAMFGGLLTSAMILYYRIYPYYAMPICIVIGALIGIVHWKQITYLQNRNRKAELVLLSCFGVLIILEGIVSILYYFLSARVPYYSYLTIPSWYEFHLFGIPLIHFIAMASFILGLFAVRFIERDQNKGTLYRAVVENVELANIQGIDTQTLNMSLWVLCGVIVCVFGCFLTVGRQFSTAYFSTLVFSEVLAGAFLGGVDKIRMSFFCGFFVAFLEKIIMMVLTLYAVFLGEFSPLLPIAIIYIALLYKSKRVIVV